MCQKYSRPVLKGYSPDAQICYLYQVRCKQWNCPECANANKVAWISKIYHGYEIYVSQGVDGWRFITITSSGKLKDAIACVDVFKKAYPRLYARAQRQFGKIKYVIVPEYHGDFRVHWHMIASGGIDTRWLKDNCAEVGLGYIAQSEELNNGKQAIGYVTKYLSKSLTVEQWPKKIKRIRTSAKWPEPPAYKSEELAQVEFKYLSTYPAEGIEYLAHEIAMKEDVRVKVIQP